MHLASPVIGDLRMNIMPDQKAGEVQLFDKMEIGDTWADADLKPCFDFLLGCKHTRTAPYFHGLVGFVAQDPC